MSTSRRTSRGAAVLAAALTLLGGGVVGVAQLLRTGPPEPALAAPVDPASGNVSGFPVPGTEVIHPEAQLSFRGPAAEDLGEIAVVGSRSGQHAGDLLAHSDGAGVSFDPAEPFTEGEEVSVTTTQDVRGVAGGDFTLRVAVLGERPRLEPPPVQEIGEEPDDPDEALAEDLVRQYVSAPGINPPEIDVAGPEAGTVTDETSPGLTALGVKNGYGQKGPMLVDDAGEPVWFLPLDGVDARDVDVQTLDGEPVLTWWEGINATGFGYGEAVVVGAAYEEVARVRMVGYDADPHEVRLTEEGTVLLGAYEPVRMDLSGVGGPRWGQAMDNIVQEIDLATGAVLFEWHSLGNVALAETYVELEGRWLDYFHLNSIDVDDDGSLLLSARHTCAVYDVDRRTGSVVWRLGGRESDYAMGGRPSSSSTTRAGPRTGRSLSSTTAARAVRRRGSPHGDSSSTSTRAG